MAGTVWVEPEGVGPEVVSIVPEPRIDAVICHIMYSW